MTYEHQSKYFYDTSLNFKQNFPDEQLSNCTTLHIKRKKHHRLIAFLDSECFRGSII